MRCSAIRIVFSKLSVKLDPENSGENLYCSSPLMAEVSTKLPQITEVGTKLPPITEVSTKLPPDNCLMT